MGITLDMGQTQASIEVPWHSPSAQADRALFINYDQIAATQDDTAGVGASGPVCRPSPLPDMAKPDGLVAIRSCTACRQRLSIRLSGNSG